MVADMNNADLSDSGPAILRRRILPKGAERLDFQGKDGVPLRSLLWSSKGDHGTVLLVPGRTEYSERYAEVIADLRDRGLAVAIIDMRNHGLSYRPLANRQKHHLTDFTPMADDIVRFVNVVTTAGLPRPFHMLAHSMGGHAALLALHDRPDLVDTVVMSAPMVRIDFHSVPDRLLRVMVKAACKLGLAESYAMGQGNWRGDTLSREALRAVLTSDRARFENEDWQLARMPELKLGGVTWGWLRAAIRSSDRLESPGFAERITTPARFILAGADKVVDNKAARQFAARMPQADVVEIKGSRHEPMREADPIRQQFFRIFFDFIGIPSDQA